MRVLIAALLLLSGSAFGQVKVAYVGEISGPLAPSGGNFRDGVILAVEEINAKGGVLKQKLDLTLFDTQTNPGVARAQMQKAIDGDPYMIFGPILSGNVKVTMQMLQQAEIPTSSAGRRPSSPAWAILICSAPRSASRSACRRSPISSATSSRQRRLP